MSEPKRYELRTVADFVALPPGKVLACIVDFEAWLSVVQWALERTNDGVRIKTPTDVFTWIDDSKHEMTVTTHDQEGNEIARDVQEIAPPES